MTQLLILMKGHPGSGKSSIATIMSTMMAIPLIDKDDARDCLESIVELADKV
jgi:shikimate kinase